MGLEVGHFRHDELLGVVSVAGQVTEALAAIGLTPERAEQLITAELADLQARKEAN